MFYIRFCPKGAIPSGKNHTDMLNEVRKAAFAQRKSRAKIDEEDDHEEQNSAFLPAVSEDWENWYPQEWIGWVRFGVPSDHPNEYWVNQPVSDGPSEVENYLVDDKGVRKNKKPHGRSEQRNQEVQSVSANKIKSDNNTLLSHHVSQVEEEIRISSSAHDLNFINMYTLNAVSEEEKIEAREMMQMHLKAEKEAFYARHRAKNNNTEKQSNNENMHRMTPINDVPYTPVESVQPSQSVNEEIFEVEKDDEETSYEYTPMDNIEEDPNNNEMSYIREFNPPSSFSGQFSPFSVDQGESATSQSDFTAQTEVYDVETLLNLPVPPHTSNPMELFMAQQDLSSISHPTSTFDVSIGANKQGDGLLRPPMPTRRNPPTVHSSVTLQPSRAYITRSSPSTNKIKHADIITERINQFHEKSWEDINNTMHGRYPVPRTNPGVILQVGFNIRNAIRDMDDLRAFDKNDLEGDPQLFGIKLWCKKLKNAIATAEALMEEAADSDDSSSLYHKQNK